VLFLVEGALGGLDRVGSLAVTVALFALAAPVAQSAQRLAEPLVRRMSAPYDATRVLARFTNRCSTANNVDELVRELDVALAASLQPKSFDLFRYDAAAGRLHAVAGPRTVPLDTVPLDTVPLDTVPLDTVPLDDVLAPLLVAEGPTLLDEEIRSGLLADAVIAVPLTLRGEPVGLLLVHRAADRRVTYLASDVELVWGLASALSIALVNAVGFDDIARENADLSRCLAEKHEELALKHKELEEKHRQLDEQHRTLVELARAQGSRFTSLGQELRWPLSILRQNLQTLERDFGEMEHDDARAMIAALCRQEVRLSELRERMQELVTVGGPLSSARAAHPSETLAA
jgi:hypothetical protein